MQKYLGVAEDSDELTTDEILSAVSIIMTVGAGSNLMQFMQALKTDKKNGEQEDDTEDCSPGCC